MIDKAISRGVTRRGFLGGIGAAAITAGLTLAGCGAQGGAGSESAADAAYRDTLNIAIAAQPPTLDSASISSIATVDIMANVMEPLYGLDGDYAPQPVLAKDAKASDDGLTWTFTLREGVKFHNGDALTAADAAATMTRWMKVNSRASQLLPGATWGATGDLELTCRLTQAAPDILTVIGAHLQYAGIAPKSVIDAADESSLPEYVGTGAYQLEEWKQDQYIHLKRYEGYKPAEGKLSGFTGAVDAPTENLYYHFVTDADTRVSGIQTGDYDIADDIPAENYQDLKDDDSVKLYVRNGGVLLAFLNMNKGVFADEAVRQAAFAAIDCDAAAKAAYSDPEVYEVTPSIMDPSNTQWTTEAGSKLFNRADPKAAKELLAKTSYNGETVRLLTTPDYKEMYNSVVALAEQLGKAGFNTEIESYEFATFMDIRANKPDEWDLFTASTSYRQTPPEMLALSTDFYGLSDEKALKDAASTRTTEDHDEAMKVWEGVQERLYEIAVTIPLCHYKAIAGSGSDVEGVYQQTGLIVWDAKRPE